MFRTVVNVSTGEIKQVPLTQDEMDEIASRPPEVIPPVVYSCNPWQIRKVLNLLDLRAAVETAVELSTDQELKDGWNHATEFRSDDHFVVSMGESLGKTEEETAQLIQLASTL